LISHRTYPDFHLSSGTLEKKIKVKPYDFFNPKRNLNMKNQ